MLNNITNFFNLIKTGKVKTQLDGTDLLPIGTKDLRFTGQYQPTMIKYSDLVAGLVGGSDGQVLFNDNDTIAGASGLYWDKINQRVGVGTSSPVVKYHQSQTQGILARYDVTNANADQNRGVWEFYTNTAVTPDFFGRFGFKFEGGINNASRQFQLHVGDNTNPRFVVNGSGNVLINTTTDAGYKLDVVGTIRATNITTPLIWSTGSDTLTLATQGGTSAVTVFPTTRNVVIQNGGTHVDAGFRLDVNGTARLNGGTNGSIQFTGNYSQILLGTDSFYISNNANTLDIIRILNDGRVGIGTNGPVSSAILDVRSSTRGFVPPRMTTLQKNQIVLPVAGLMVYDTDLNRPCFYNGTSWITL